MSLSPVAVMMAPARPDDDIVTAPSPRSCNRGAIHRAPRRPEDPDSVLAFGPGFFQGVGRRSDHPRQATFFVSVVVIRGKGIHAAATQAQRLRARDPRGGDSEPREHKQDGAPHGDALVSFGEGARKIAGKGDTQGRHGRARPPFGRNQKKRFDYVREDPATEEALLHFMGERRGSRGSSSWATGDPPAMASCTRWPICRRWRTTRSCGTAATRTRISNTRTRCTPESPTSRTASCNS